MSANDDSDMESVNEEKETNGVKRKRSVPNESRLKVY